MSVVHIDLVSGLTFTPVELILEIDMLNSFFRLMFFYLVPL
ncbi:hypothetical protein DSOL_2217 [Desulfosporosinus metallidurans]|uniref:Uncharacterized protein n=1 Tax=Desulfosporosinus metallidurans TaxID=1888891 RepID=A0A1Q8QX55_9FIRM|nr:hypothetical protein DSOL_2217 [Desulfosporosinus metallidurans]